MCLFCFVIFFVEIDDYVLSLPHYPVVWKKKKKKKKTLHFEGFFFFFCMYLYSRQCVVQEKVGGCFCRRCINHKTVVRLYYFIFSRS